MKNTKVLKELLDYNENIQNTRTPHDPRSLGIRELTHSWPIPKIKQMFSNMVILFYKASSMYFLFLL